MNFENMDNISTNGSKLDKGPRNKLFVEIRGILDQAKDLLIVPQKNGSAISQVDINRLNGYFKEIEFSYQEGTSGSTLYQELREEIFDPILEKLKEPRDQRAKENLKKVWSEIAMKVFGQDTRKIYRIEESI